MAALSKELLRPNMIKLQLRQNPNKYAKLMSSAVSIGRDKNNILVIDDPSVSDFHAEIVRSDNQQFCVVDLLSAAGTFVNNERISGRCLFQPGIKYVSVTSS